MEHLAIDGGKPVRDTILPYGHQSIDEQDIEAVAGALCGDWITQGPVIEEFEKKVAGYCNARYAVAMSSGTGALHAACTVAGIAPGDEAITTPITFAATANAVVYCGGKPVFADITRDTWNIDPEEIKQHVSPRTKVILPVDFAGHPADLDDIMTIARHERLTVIEDASHALGAEYRGRKIGSLADMTVFSFHPVKHITTGEGGMVLTDNREYYENLRIFRHHGIIKDNPEEPWHSAIVKPGYNLRITDFQCALGVSQMSKLDSFIERRREIAAHYQEAFSTMAEIINPLEQEDVTAVYHIYVIQLRLELLKAGRREVFTALRAENIGVNVHYVPVHLHPFYRREFGYSEGDYPIAESYYRQAITLPLFPAMTDTDIEDVIRAVKKVITCYSRK